MTRSATFWNESMISIQEVRELMEDSEKYSDAEIERIRDDMRIFAEIIFESWMKEKNSEVRGRVTILS